MTWKLNIELIQKYLQALLLIYIIAIIQLYTFTCNYTFIMFFVLREFSL